MLKVFFVISGLGYSGAEIVLDRYINNNKTIDPYFVIIYNSIDLTKQYIDKYGNDKVFSLCLKHSKNILRFFPLIDILSVNKKIKPHISNIKPDIVYANNTIEVMLLSKFVSENDIISVGHIHDMKNSIKSIIRKMVTQNSLKSYNKIITVSEATKKQWKDESIDVIYNGIENKYFSKNLNNNTKIKNIGYVGNISKRKGTDIFINEIDELVSKNLHLNLVYLNIEDYEIYNNIINKRKKYPNSINLYHKLNENEIFEFYKSIDVLVVPSRQDPLPTVVMESISQGTLVIGNKTDGIPEMIRDERLLFDISKDNCIGNTIDELNKLDTCELNSIREKQYYYCYKSFSSDKKLKAVNNILLTLTDKSYKKKLL